MRLPFSDSCLIANFEELLESIKTKGLMNPLLVTRINGQYFVVDGVSRYFCLQILRKEIEYEQAKMEFLWEIAEYRSLMRRPKMMTPLESLKTLYKHRMLNV